MLSEVIRRILQAGGQKTRHWIRSMGAAPLLMLPVLLMFALQAFDISPRWEADSLALKARTLASGDAVSDEAARFEQLPALPAPPSWDYWQKALISANATGLAPPVYRGNWMEAAHGRLRWFEIDAKARQMRPVTWWGYADPAPPPQSDTVAGKPGGGKGGRGAGKGGSGSRQGGGTAKHSGSSNGGSTRKGGGEGSGKGSSSGANSGGKTAVRRRRLTAHQHPRRRVQAADSDRQRDSWLTGLKPPLQQGPAAGADPGERSRYLPWILSDLEPWAKNGIEEADVQRAANLAGRWGSVCIEDMLHFQIISGRLYVRFLTGNAKGAGIHNADSDGWFPGNQEAGVMAAKGRVPHLIFMLLDVLRAFPGQIPDVSAVVQASDFPCIKAAQDTPDTDFRADWQQLPPEHFDGRPIPVFGYNRREGFMDLLFPDFTYFGHDYSQITDPTGRMLSGLPQQLDVITATHAFTPLERRLPKVMWRGRATEPRDEIRRKLLACPAQLEAAGQDAAGKLFDLVTPEAVNVITKITLKSSGLFRYNVYVDAGAYLSNLKQKLAAGSPLLMVMHRYQEWYTRTLRNGYTHVSVPDDDSMCNDTWAKVQLMEEMVREQAAAIQAAKHPPPWLQAHAEEWGRHPWGGSGGGDDDIFRQLRDWTLAQRGIAVGGLHAYEDSFFYVAPPQPPSNFSGGDNASDEVGGAADDGGGNSSAEAGGAANGSLTVGGGGSGGAADGGGSRLAALLAGAARGARSEAPKARAARKREAAAQRQALSAARGRLAAQRAFEARAAEAKAARESWEQEQKRLRKAVPKQLWRRAKDAWGSELLPWEIGAFGQLFVRDRLRLRDVRLYIKDLLGEYAKLQMYKPQIAPLARCMDWQRMLHEFAWPHYSQDVEHMLHFYPYLRQPFNYDCADDPWESGKPPFSPGHDAGGDVYKSNERWQEQYHGELMRQMAELLQRVDQTYAEV